MSVLFDHQIFNYQKYGGISRMFAEIMSYLYAKDVEFDHVVQRSENAFLVSKPFYRPLPPPIGPAVPDVGSWLFQGSLPGKGRLYRYLYRKELSKLAEINADYVRVDPFSRGESITLEKILSRRYSVFHPTYYNDYFLDACKKAGVPIILTVYDMIHELFPGYFPADDLVLRTKKRLAEVADVVVAISNSTRSDLVNIYNIPESKIEVIHLGASLAENTPLAELPTYLRDYILYVGDRWIYKNFLRFIDSVVPIIEKHKTLVVLAGSQPLSAEEWQYLSAKRVAGKIIHIPITSDNQLAALYHNARMFVFPSLYEGFGIPLIEAMSQGCPVACSNTSSFQEVVDDAAELFDPWNVESITYSIKKVMESDEYRVQLKKKGHERIKRFSWNTAGEQYLKIYNKFK